MTKARLKKLGIKPNEILVSLIDYHHDGGDKVIAVTHDEWVTMTKDAEENGHPIDGSTVDWSALGEDEGVDREDLRPVLTGAEIDSIEQVIPLV